MFIKWFLIINYYLWWANSELRNFTLNKNSDITSIWCSWMDSHLHSISLRSWLHWVFAVVWVTHLSPVTHPFWLVVTAESPGLTRIPSLRVSRREWRRWLLTSAMGLALERGGWDVTYGHLMCHRKGFGLGSRTAELQFQWGPLLCYFE